jgi:hypothetical protein
MNETGISVGRIYDAGSYAAEIGSFRKGASLSYGQGKVYDEAFAHTDQLFSIGRGIEQGVQATDQPKEKPKVTAIPKDVPIRELSLRSQPIYISNQMKINNMLIEYDFFDLSRNPHGSFVNSFVDNNDGTVTDKAAGLMWQKSGSSSSLDIKGANRYVKQLNEQQFAGYSDWRMPTVEELASLLARIKKDGVHIDPVFDNRQAQCWTADQCDPKNISIFSGTLIIDFNRGSVSQAEYEGPMKTVYSGILPGVNHINYVKAVRSVK